MAGGDVSRLVENDAPSLAVESKSRPDLYGACVQRSDGVPTMHAAEAEYVAYVADGRMDGAL